MHHPARRVVIVVTPRFAGQATFVEHGSQHACR